jgi:hypothetical protein
MAIKTTWTEVNQIIKEEFQRVMEKKKIQSRIQQINEELAHMEEEDSTMMGEDTLEEVEAGGEMKVRSHAWTGEEDGDTKWTPEFDHKGSALMEEDEIEVGDEDEDIEEEGSLADEFAELGAAIEAKIMAALGHMNHEASETAEEETMENDEDSEDEEFEEVEVSDEEGEDDTMEEYREVVPMGDHGATTTHDDDQDGIEEGEEEGEMKKEPMNESVSRKDKKYLNVLSEGMDSKRQSALEGEIERMRKLAKLGNND